MRTGVARAITLVAMLEAFAGDAHDDKQARSVRNEAVFQGPDFDSVDQKPHNENGDPKAAESCLRGRVDCFTGSSC
jgi:hypothetical protein